MGCLGFISFTILAIGGVLWMSGMIDNPAALALSSFFFGVSYAGIVLIAFAENILNEN